MTPTTTEPAELADDAALAGEPLDLIHIGAAGVALATDSWGPEDFSDWEDIGG